MGAKEATTAHFEVAKKNIDHWVNYYERKANILKLISLSLRSLAALGFVGGTMAPFVAAIEPESERSFWLGVGYALLGFAGVMLFVDQFFVVTKGWMRFIKARLSLGFLKEAVTFEQDRFAMIATDEAKLAEILPATMEKITKFHEDLRSAVLTETDSWETDQTQAIKTLEDKLGAAAVAAKTDADNQRSKERLKLGAISVAVEIEDGVGIEAATVTLGEIVKPLSKPFSGPTVFDRVPAGIWAIRLVWKHGNAESRQEMPVEVKENEIAGLTFKVRKTPGKQA